MTLLVAASTVLGVVALATALGLWWRARQGLVRRHDRDLVALLGEAPLGRDATLLQFSSEYCAPCRATARSLSTIAVERDGVAHVEIDVTDRPDLAQRLQILQTPTTFVLDGRGRSRARIGGAPRPADVLAALDALRENRHVAA